jgi:hypothetical protein
MQGAGPRALGKMRKQSSPRTKVINTTFNHIFIIWLEIYAQTTLKVMSQRSKDLFFTAVVWFCLVAVQTSGDASVSNLARHTKPLEEQPLHLDQDAILADVLGLNSPVHPHQLDLWFESTWQQKWEHRPSTSSGGPPLLSTDHDAVGLDTILALLRLMVPASQMQQYVRVLHLDGSIMAQSSERLVWITSSRNGADALLGAGVTLCFQVDKTITSRPTIDAATFVNVPENVRTLLRLRDRVATAIGTSPSPTAPSPPSSAPPTFPPATTATLPTLPVLRFEFAGVARGEAPTSFEHTRLELRVAQQDTVVVQLTGSELWEVCIQDPATEIAGSQEPSLCRLVTMAAEDRLYMPEGTHFRHVATGLEPTGSSHLSIAPFQRTSKDECNSNLLNLATTIAVENAALAIGIDYTMEDLNDDSGNSWNESDGMEFTELDVQVVRKGLAIAKQFDISEADCFREDGMVKSVLVYNKMAKVLARHGLCTDALPLCARAFHHVYWAVEREPFSMDSLLQVCMYGGHFLSTILLLEDAVWDAHV